MNNNMKNKQKLIEEIKIKLQNAKSVVFVDYKGTSVDKDTALRSAFRKAGCEYKVYKNRLVLRALNELDITGFEDKLNGTTAIAFGIDEVGAAKVLLEMSKNNKNFQTKFGILDKHFVDGKTVEHLGSLPTKEVLVAQLLSVIIGPIRNLACCVKAISEKEA